jgi:hypothetical protein
MTVHKQESNTVSEFYKTVAMNVLLPLVMVALMGMLGWMSKLEERQYALQREAVTEQKLGATENRIMSYMDVRMKDMDNKLNLMIRQLELLSYNKGNNKE